MKYVLIAREVLQPIPVMNKVIIGGAIVTVIGLVLLALNWRSEVPRRLFWAGFGMMLVGAAARFFVQIVH